LGEVIDAYLSLFHRTKNDYLDKMLDIRSSKMLECFS
jgi:hypothetical protein